MCSFGRCCGWCVSFMGQGCVSFMGEGVRGWLVCEGGRVGG